MTITHQQAEAMDEAAEWAARAHPLPFPWIKATALACFLAAIAGYFCPDWSAVARLFSRLR